MSASPCRIRRLALVGLLATGGISNAIAQQRTCYGTRLAISVPPALSLPGLSSVLETLQGASNVLGVYARPILDAGGHPGNCAEPAGPPVPGALRNPTAVFGTMPYCQREIGIMPDRTSKAKTRPGSASVTVHVVVQRRPPFSLRPTNTAPLRTSSPLRNCIATTSSASEASVGRSVISPYTRSGLASISTVTVTEGPSGSGIPRS